MVIMVSVKMITFVKNILIW